MPGRLMVGQRVLVPSIRVQLLTGQHVDKFNYEKRHHSAWGAIGKRIL
ncbi:MAG: hypothetical protein UX35_C0016G0021 [Microgenomates group bacterium GW2011_GWA1_46_15]|nr:MAG: hypothetical protein UX00_C0015G0023 [Microgenomates group bacterium GW2011_GWB1_45_17]KKU22777.1 MAG: hypothetical protein UX35_C0016G0021 [Microgenomates group bacterium GW2011_GWA1_46_15]KKU24040.1 MAG: hypothetical protein UX36_C0002G0023 [Microgenomates group bacterium GW2011_GWC1_46_15]